MLGGSHASRILLARPLLRRGALAAFKQQRFLGFVSDSDHKITPRKKQGKTESQGTKPTAPPFFAAQNPQTSAAHADEIAGPGKFSKKHGFTTDPKDEFMGQDTVSDDLLREEADESASRFTLADYEDKLVKLPTPRQLKAYLDKYIVGQENCKKVMSVAVYNHYIRINDSLIRNLKEREEILKQKNTDLFQKDPTMLDSKSLEVLTDLPELEKSNVLLLGPSGSGKTLIAKTLAKVLNVPIVIQDCTSLTQSGYVGDDIESCVEKLLIKANYDVELCQQGIIVLDELDKLAKPSIYTGTKDIAGEGVQQGLLKLIEGTIVSVQARKQTGSKDSAPGRPIVPVRSGGEVYTVDTSQILFVSMGAFIGLEKIVASRLSNSTIGFEMEEESKEDAGEGEVEEDRIVDYVTLESGKRVSALDAVAPTDLHTFGLIPELIGRIPIVSVLSPLTTQDLVSILTEPKNSIIKQYEYFFSRIGVRLAITSTAIEHIAKISIKNGTGARGLRSVLEKILLTVNYDCPGSGVSFVLIDDDVITNFNDAKGTTSDLKAKYFSRGEIFKFLSELGAEDTTLMKKIEEEYQIPCSDKVSLEMQAAA